MHRERGGGSSKSEMVGSLDRKRINDALDKHLEKSSPSTSKGLNIKDKDRLSVPSTSAGKTPPDHRETRSASLSKGKCTDGWFYCCSLFFFQFVVLRLVCSSYGWWMSALSDYLVYILVIYLESIFLGSSFDWNFFLELSIDENSVSLSCWGSVVCSV